MREDYHRELDTLLDRMVELTRIVETMMGRATTALLDADPSVAEDVMSLEDSVQVLYHDLDDRALRLLALQQPVATDLRTVVATLRISADLERMGVLARHVAEVATQRHPQPAVPPQLRATILTMGQVAQRIIAKAGSAIASKEAEYAVSVARRVAFLAGTSALDCSPAPEAH